ncbi:MAG TPA: DUF3667 domain-containing protein [Gammaproteobacteria bacterium]|nr:DUF3667 domain-containing protein [Gammaproteobacteria bacterium]
MTGAVEAPAACVSCGHPLAGENYCSRCGEEVLDPSKLTLRYFLSHTLVHELFNFDGKIWRTLRLLLFSPAFLALEYSAGRRRPYVNPLRVLIVAIIVYVLATPGTGFTLRFGDFQLAVAPAPMSQSIGGVIDQIDRFGILERMFAERFGPSENASDELRIRFNRALNGFATPLSFTTVVMAALVLYGLFHRRRPLLVEHMVFSMHYFSAVLLWLLAPLLVFRLNLLAVSMTFLLVLPVVLIWHVVYLAIALRRFYFSAGGGQWRAWTVSAVVALVVYLLNSVFITAVQFAGAAFAITRL